MGGESYALVLCRGGHYRWLPLRGAPPQAVRGGWVEVRAPGATLQSALRAASSPQGEPFTIKIPLSRNRGEGDLIISLYCSRKRERNSTVRGFCGCPKISVGVPSSQMTPSAM